MWDRTTDLAHLVTDCLELLLCLHSVLQLKKIQTNLFQKHLLFLHQLTTIVWQNIVHWITSSVHENCKLKTWGEHAVYTSCSECQNKNKKQFVYKTCSELGIFMYWTRNSMNNLSSYYGLVDTRISTKKTSAA